MKTVKYYQFYWNCLGFHDKFQIDGWKFYHIEYKPIVEKARKWCDDLGYDVSYHDGAPFIFTFYNKEDVIMFKLVWGSGNVLECYEEGGYTII
jgi:hypothetical protein